jgi:hypothetical protein
MPTRKKLSEHIESGKALYAMNKSYADKLDESLNKSAEIANNKKIESKQKVADMSKKTNSMRRHFGGKQTRKLKRKNKTQKRK